MDGGIRSGQDVLRPGPSAPRGFRDRPRHGLRPRRHGRNRRHQALQIPAQELDVTMAFCGHTQLRNVSKDILVPGTAKLTMRRS